jgi:hypothetical protein
LSFKRQLNVKRNPNISAIRKRAAVRMGRRLIEIEGFLDANHVSPIALKARQ